MSDRPNRRSQKPWRGSRLRCLELTGGAPTEVAQRLTALAAPWGRIEAGRDSWAPRGIDNDEEALLGEALHLLCRHDRESLLDWWLADRANANTPNWDIAATATIDDREGLLLVEAKAHGKELKREDCSGAGEKNRPRIAAAIQEANDALNRVLSGWRLSCDSHFQLSNRFAWAWKIASLGMPVVLVYLGFLNDVEVDDLGPPFSGAAAWRAAVLDYANDIVPEKAWRETLMVGDIPLRARISSRVVGVHP